MAGPRRMNPAAVDDAGGPGRHQALRDRLSRQAYRAEGVRLECSQPARDHAAQNDSAGSMTAEGTRARGRDGPEAARRRSRSSPGSDSSPSPTTPSPARTTVPDDGTRKDAAPIGWIVPSTAAAMAGEVNAPEPAPRIGPNTTVPLPVEPVTKKLGLAVTPSPARTTVPLAGEAREPVPRDESGPSLGDPAAGAVNDPTPIAWTRPNATTLPPELVPCSQECCKPRG